MNNNNNNRSNNCATPAIDNTPCLNDILLGKGHHLNPGNLWLVQYLLKHKAEYQQMSRDCKGPFLTKIIESVLGTGRHFYMKDDNGEKWNVIKMGDRSVTNLGRLIIRQSIVNMINRRGRVEESSVIIRVCKDGRFIEADTGKLSITEEEKQSSKNNFQQNNIILEKFMANQKVRKSAEKEIKKSYVHMRKRYQTRVHPIRKYPIRKYRKVTK